MRQDLIRKIGRNNKGRAHFLVIRGSSNKFNSPIKCRNARDASEQSHCCILKGQNSTET